MFKTVKLLNVSHSITSIVRINQILFKKNKDFIVLNVIGVSELNLKIACIKTF